MKDEILDLSQLNLADFLSTHSDETARRLAEKERTATDMDRLASETKRAEETRIKALHDKLVEFMTKKELQDFLVAHDIHSVLIQRTTPYIDEDRKNQQFVNYFLPIVVLLLNMLLELKVGWIRAEKSLSGY